LELLNNKTALITGASRGIGKGIALALGKSSVEIIATATSQNGVDNINSYLQENNIKGHGAIVNLSNNDSIDTLIASFGKNMPDILINNAAITRDNLLMRMKDDEWNDVINTNLNSIYKLSKACLRSMMKARYGRIINLTSMVALSGNAGQTNYAASKAGMIGFTKSLAREVGSRGITVNCIAPGFIDTDMIKTINAEQRKKHIEQIPLKRAGSIEDIAEAVVFLVNSSYITGETLNINGGLYM
jgi:3-oxoacyl-[acyl-carrier protein] reductase